MATKLHRTFLLIGCLFVFNGVAFASLNVSLGMRVFAAQSQIDAPTPAPPPIVHLMQTVIAKGFQHSMSARSVSLLGFSPQALSEKEIDIDVESGQRSAECFQVDGHTYLLLSFNDSSFDNMSGFLLNDSGEVVKGFKGGKKDGLQELPLPDAIVQAAPEKAFWLKWLAAPVRRPAPAPKR